MMKPMLLHITCFLTLSALYGQKAAKQSFQGAWKVVYERYEFDGRSEEAPLIDRDGVFVEERDRYDYPEEHWVFRGSKVYRIAFPCCLLSSGTLTQKDSAAKLTLSIGYTTEVLYSSSIGKDTIFFSDPMSTYCLVRDTLNAAELDPLLKGIVNPKCLWGTWEIPTGEVAVPDDGIMISYPWKMPDSLTITPENQHWYLANNRFYLEVDGVKRPFKVKSIDSEGYGGIYLEPETWVKAYMEKYDLYPSEVEHVWLRRVPEEEEE